MTEKTKNFFKSAWQGVKSTVVNNPVVKATGTEIQSVRTKVLYGVAAVWGISIYILVNFINRVLNTSDCATRDKVVALLIPAMSNIFYVISFIFFIIICVYVLKRSVVHIKAWGIEVDLGDNGSKTIEKQVSKPEDTPIVKVPPSMLR